MATRVPTVMTTPSPVASTTPAASCPTVIGYGSGLIMPSRMCRSVPHTPAAWMRTSTSPRPGDGVATLSTPSVRSSWICAARITIGFPLSLIDCWACVGHVPELHLVAHRGGEYPLQPAQLGGIHGCGEAVEQAGALRHELVIRIVGEHRDSVRTDRVVGHVRGEMNGQLAIAPLTGQHRGEPFGARALPSHLEQVARVRIRDRVHGLQGIDSADVAAQALQETAVCRQLGMDDLRGETRHDIERIAVGRMAEDQSERASVVLEIEDVLLEVPAKPIVWESAGADVAHHRMLPRESGRA